MSDHLWGEDNRRTDRRELAVVQEGDHWVVAKDGIVIIHDCPCCLLPMKSAQSAQLICEVIYPPRREPS